MPPRYIFKIQFALINFPTFTKVLVLYQFHCHTERALKYLVPTAIYACQSHIHHSRNNAPTDLLLQPQGGEERSTYYKPIPIQCTMGRQLVHFEISHVQERMHRNFLYDLSMSEILLTRNRVHIKIPTKSYVGLQSRVATEQEQQMLYNTVALGEVAAQYLSRTTSHKVKTLCAFQIYYILLSSSLEDS